MADLDKVERATRQCRDAVREAHEAIKDLNTALAEQREFIRANVEDKVNAEVALQVERHVKLLGNATQAAMAASVAKVSSEFDRLAGIFLGTDDGGPALDELVKRRAARGSGAGHG